MRINELLRGMELMTVRYTNEKINTDTIQKEINNIVTALQSADKSLYSIATVLQQNNKYDIRKDILSFIANINDMYEYLVIGLMEKINPPSEEDKGSK